MKTIKTKSEQNLATLISKIEDAYPQGEAFHKSVCVYACGSLGRLEMVENSDLDLFFIIMNSSSEEKKALCSNLDKYNFFAKLHNIHKELGYEDPSKQGLYWDFISQSNLLDIGSREEDFNNSFTARMLLLLESKPLYNENAYNELVKSIVDKYFVDYGGHKSEFYPLFLMNDILRYWYTLTLNYEYRRDNNDSENDKNWKRLKLKYSRLITCFSMLSCLYITEISPEFVIECIKMTPFERLNMLTTHFKDINNIIREIETRYQWFLDLRKKDHKWWESAENKKTAIENAEGFHQIVVHGLMNKLSIANPELHKRSDSY